MKLERPDQLTVVLLWIAAIFMAAKAGVEQWPVAAEALPGLQAPWLSLLPLVLLTWAGIRQLRPTERSPASTRKEAVSTQDEAARAAAPVTVVEATPPVPQRAPGEAPVLPAKFAEEFEELLFTSPTPLQIKRMLKPYEGKVAIIKVRLASISKYGNEFMVQCHYQRGSSVSKGFFVYFSEVWEDHLSHISTMEEFSFKARVKLDDGNFLFTDAEVLELG